MVVEGPCVEEKGQELPGDRSFLLYFIEKAQRGLKRSGVGGRNRY
jgi:hypothetical protein